MSIDSNSELWSHLADWVKLILLRPDPPPEQFTQLNDVVIMTAITALAERLSPEVGTELRRALPAIQAGLRAA